MTTSTAPGQPRIGVAVPFAAIVLAMLPAVLDQTILATALPVVTADLGQVSDVAWVVTAYVIAAAATTPLWGKLGDRYGRKRLLELALIGFLGGSAVCGLAPNLTILIGARTLQGVAAGGLMSLAMAAVGDLVSPRERGRYQGYIAAAFAVATIVGPLLGGVLVDTAGWRWVFYVNLPLGLLAVAGLRLRLPEGPVEEHPRQLDLFGAALLVLSVSTLLLVCVWGGDRYAWNSSTILVLIAAVGALAVALAVHERRAADPIVPLTLLRTPTVAVASAALFLATAALFAVNVFVPLFLQRTTGATATEAGLLLVPMMLGITVSTNVAGRATARTGRYRRYPVAGLGLMVVGLVGLAGTASHPSRVAVGVLLVVFGAGFGLVGQMLIVAVQNSVDRRQLGTAMAATSFFRGLGGAVGAAVLGAVFAARATAGATGDVVIRAEVVHGARAVWIGGAGLAALGFLVALGLRELPLDQRRPEPVPTSRPTPREEGRP